MNKILAFSCNIETSAAHGTNGTAMIATNMASFWELLENIPEADKILWVLERFAPVDLLKNKVKQDWYSWSDMFQKMFVEIARFLFSKDIPHTFEQSEIYMKDYIDSEDSDYNRRVIKWSMAITILDEEPKKPTEKKQ